MTQNINRGINHLWIATFLDLKVQATAKVKAKVEAEAGKRTNLEKRQAMKESFS